MKNKSKFFSKFKWTDDRLRFVMFKLAFHRLRMAKLSWNEIAADIYDGLIIYNQNQKEPEPKNKLDVSGELLIHYYNGTKIPSLDHLLKLLKSLNLTKHSSPRIQKIIDKLTRHQKLKSKVFDKKENDRFNRGVKNIELKRVREIKKALKNLRAPLKTLIYYSRTVDELNDMISILIKDLNVELDSEMDAMNYEMKYMDYDIE